VRTSVSAGDLGDHAASPEKAEAQSSGEFSPLRTGQNATGCKEIPAGELTRELTVEL
jgi:hypothetical protein